MAARASTTLSARAQREEADAAERRHSRRVKGKERTTAGHVDGRLERLDSGLERKAVRDERFEVDEARLDETCESRVPPRGNGREEGAREAAKEDEASVSKLVYGTLKTTASHEWPSDTDWRIGTGT